MSIVLDASVAIEWFLEDRNAEAAREIGRLLLDDTAWVTQLWHLEVGNVLTLAVRRGTMSPAERSSAFDALRSMVIGIDDATAVHAWDRSTALADKHNLTLYDASYLELAVRLSLPLATFDKDLAKAARAEGVTVLP